MILYYFDLEHYIQIDMNGLGYVIGGVSSQISLDQHSSNYMTYQNSNSSKSEINQWYFLVYFSQKMIMAKTDYKIVKELILKSIPIAIKLILWDAQHEQKKSSHI